MAVPSHAEIERSRRVFEATAQGPYIRNTREAARVTLRELARRLDLSAPFISDVEHGRRMLGQHHWPALKKALPNIDLGEMEIRTPPCPRCEVALRLCDRELTGNNDEDVPTIASALRAQYVAGLERAARDAETYCPLNASVSALILQREIATHIRALAEQAKEKP